MHIDIICLFSPVNPLWDKRTLSPISIPVAEICINVCPALSDFQGKMCFPLAILPSHRIAPLSSHFVCRGKKGGAGKGYENLPESLVWSECTDLTSLLKMLLKFSILRIRITLVAVLETNGRFS